MEIKNFKQKVVTGFAWEGITKLLIQIISWVTTIIVARILLPTDYGIVAIATVFIELLTVATRVGLTQGLINKPSVTSEQLDSVFWLNFLIGLGLYAVLYLSTPIIVNIYDIEILGNILKISGLILIFSSLKAVPIAIALRDMNFRYRALVEMVGNLSMSVTVVTLALNDYGVWSLVYAVVVRHVVEVIAYLPIIKRLPRLIINFKEIISIMIFGIKVVAINLLEFVILRSDVFIIGLLLGQKQVGYYSMGFQLATIPMDKFGSIFNIIAFPSISKIKDDKQQSKLLFINMHRYLITIAYPVLIGLLLVADDAVKLLLTEKWLPIVPLIQVLCAVNLLRVSAMLMPYALTGKGEVDSVLKFHFVAAIILPCAFLIGAQFGMKGILYAWFIAYIPIYAYILLLTLKHFSIKLMELITPLKSTFMASAVMFIAVFICKVIMPDNLIYIRIMSCIAVGVITYISIFFLFYRSELLEIKKGIMSVKG